VAVRGLNRGQIFNAAIGRLQPSRTTPPVLQLAGVDDEHSSKPGLLRADVLAKRYRHTAAAADLKAVLRSADVDDRIAAQARRLLKQIKKVGMSRRNREQINGE
jgi:hypothetical protein